MPNREDLGRRLGAQGRRLRLLIAHLAGGAVRRRVEAEDLVQEVFLRALAGSAEPPAHEPGEAALARWLNAIARHVVIDAARAARAAKRDGRVEPLVRADWSQVGVAESRVPAAGPGPATRVACADEEAQLLAAYRSLAPDHRRVLGLRQFEGLSAAQTAERMGRGESAMHSLYRRALQAWEQAATTRKTEPGRRTGPGPTP
jgi:RNA polymerase sigma-70 factor, ECF subfamily